MCEWILVCALGNAEWDDSQFISRDLNIYASQCSATIFAIFETFVQIENQ